jgi:nucleoside 2-deoxyribosyltransferase
MAKVYLAGPLGFTESGDHYHKTVLRPAVEQAGHELLDPWEYGAIRFGMLKDDRDEVELGAANRDVGSMNEVMIREADAVLAVLDGSDVDSGTAAEVGFAAAIGKPVVGIRSDLRKSGDNKATAVNLQVAHFVRSSGGIVTVSLSDAISALVSVVDS